MPDDRGNDIDTPIDSVLDNTSNAHMSNLKGYLFFLVGQWVSILGSNVVNFSIVWFLTLATQSEFVLGLSAFLAFMPFLLVTPIAGVFIDRWNRKVVIAFVDFMQAFFTFILILCFASNLFSNLELVIILLGLNFIRGIFGAFHSSATTTLLPIMVPKAQLSRINGMNFFVNAGLRIAGPLLGAMALEYFVISEILWLDIITFLIAIVPTLIITIPNIAKRLGKAEKPKTFTAELNEGISFIKKTPGLLPLLIVFAGANFFLTPLFTQMAFLVKFIHLGNSDDLAFLFALQNGGMLFSSLIMSTWKGFNNHAFGVTLGLFLGYFGVVIMIIAPLGNFFILGAGIFITGFVLPVANVSSEAIWGSTVPRDILGRVYAVRRTLAQISAPISMLLSGVLAQAFGLLPVLTIATVIGLLLLAYSWFFTPLPEVEKRINMPTSKVDNE
ncbi:MAG: MFS transporter [Candidatus Hodarchaeales archaeon]